MARRRISGESTSDLYIRLGLSLDELESGFVDAQRTIRDNMSRLWRENTIIDLQAKVELTGLDETADAEQILAIRTRALNEQIKNQKDRVRLAAAELRNMTERTGENSDQTQRARIALEHHRLELARLEDQLNSLNEEEEDSPGILSRFMDAFDNFARQCWNVIGIVEVFGGAITDLVDGFRELQTQAYELNMPVNDVENFLRHMRLAGGDIGDFEGFIRGITDAYVKGEVDDPEFIALSKYGAKITDVTGRLKNFEEITEEVYQAYLKAKEAGEEIEFLQLVGGESGVRDAIQYFERYAEAKEDAEKIFDAGLDPDELHEADRALRLLTEQMGEFKDAIVNIGVSKATDVMKALFEVFRAGTEIVSESTDAIHNFLDTLQTGYVLKGDFPIYDKLGAIIDGVEKYFEIQDRVKEQERRGKDTFWITDAFEQLREMHFRENGIDPNDVDMSLRWSWGKYAEEAEEAAEATEEAAEATEELTTSWAQFQQKMHGDSDDEPLSQYAATRIKEFKDELAELRNELDNWDSEYLQSLGELELWRDNELNDKLHVSKDERIAIEELYSAKLEQIERERADKLDEIREEIAAGDRTALENKIASIEKEKDDWISAGMEEAEAVELSQRLITKAREDALKKARDIMQETADLGYALTHDALEKQIYDIERWKQAQFEKAETAEEIAATIANAAMREADAFEREIDRIQGRIESAQDRLARLTLSQYDNDVRNAYKQYQQDIEDNIPTNLAQAIFDATMKQIKRRASEDTTGKYTQKPDRDDEPYMLIDFNRAVQDTTRSLIDMDARQLALQQTMARAAEMGSDTVNQAMDIVRAVEEQRTPPALPQKEEPSGVETIYGDRVEELANTTEKVIHSLNLLESSTTSVDGVLADFNTSTQKTYSALDVLTGKFEQTADIFAGISEQLSQIDLTNLERAPQSEESQGLSDKFDVLKKGMESTALGGELAALVGLIRGDPRIALIGAAVQALSNSGLFIKDTVDDLSESRGDSKGVGVTDLTAAMEPLMQEIQTLTQDVSSRLDEITQYAGEIAANTNQPPQQNITVSPNINIDLGGAYVFDNAMKQQLTDDITRDVANAVTDAVKKATDKTDYSYGR